MIIDMLIAICFHLHQTVRMANKITFFKVEINMAAGPRSKEALATKEIFQI